MSSSMLLPITIETYEDHFVDHGWSSPQDQIDAGFPLVIQPTALSALFEDIHDLGTVLAQGALITVSPSVQNIVSGVVLDPTLSLSADGSTWTDYPSVWSVFSSGFQFVKIRIEASGDGVALMRLNQVKLTIAVREIRDDGSGTALAADTGGTAVAFNKQFIDVESITVTPKFQIAETKGITAVYDFTDAPYPTGFTVYLFSNLTGARIDGAFSWKASGSG